MRNRKLCNGCWLNSRPVKKPGKQKSIHRSHYFSIDLPAILMTSSKHKKNLLQRMGDQAKGPMMAAEQAEEEAALSQCCQRECLRVTAYLNFESRLDETSITQLAVNALSKSKIISLTKLTKSK